MMIEEEKQTLNKKLAEWVGFVDTGFGMFKRYSKAEPVTLIQRPQLGTLTKELNFTQRLDACFKWLIPSLPEGYVYLLFRDGFSWVAEIHGADGLPRADSLGLGADNPALALCLALEKLIKPK